MSQQTAQRSNRDVLLGALELLNAGAYDRLDEFYHEDVVIDRPQMDERLRGVANMRAVLSNYPGGHISFIEDDSLRVTGEGDRYLLTPMFTMLRVEGAGDTLVSRMKTRYPDGSYWWVVYITTFRDGKIAAQEQYYAPEVESPEWRAQWVEPMSTHPSA